MDWRRAAITFRVTFFELKSINKSHPASLFQDWEISVSLLSDDSKYVVLYGSLLNLIQNLHISLWFGVQKESIWYSWPLHSRIAELTSQVPQIQKWWSVDPEMVLLAFTESIANSWSARYSQWPQGLFLPDLHAPSLSSSDEQGVYFST